MNLLSKISMAVALVAMTACTNNSALDDTNSVNLGGSAGAGAGSAADPSSPAYFQQAVGDRVLFEVDQSTLNDAARATLLAQANWLLENTDFSATIEGHADEQGTREYNLALGARRANAAREFLISRGVAGSRLKVVSYGKERPIEICSEEACYANNRRAVTVLAGGLTG
ncbi:peptidoglycan-associated lipoprotein Pal [Tropicibacter sp. R16_0]|uniref:peptidoglycan-associated lipoprotein Pal n=1 Tax=Tropicibacter sp. R16_0 TaxID=2821102 RepID=UPI001ADCD426|nr:peptidoglycan-associated lipoprotein Pal [Tropicibacter sp. R16_0]MBO9451580.1 peptidoglycan-associated lipoprotein Pal [Tropicibacter sp. R16_0]